MNGFNMFMQGLNGLDIILVFIFVYISIKLIKRYKKESEE